MVQPSVVDADNGLIDADDDGGGDPTGDPTANAVRPSVDADDGLIDADDNSGATANAARPFVDAGNFLIDADNDNGGGEATANAVRPSVDADNGLIDADDDDGSVNATANALRRSNYGAQECALPAYLQAWDSRPDEPASNSENWRASQALLESRLHLGQLRASFEASDEAQMLDLLVGLDL